MPLLCPGSRVRPRPRGELWLPLHAWRHARPWHSPLALCGVQRPRPFARAQDEEGLGGKVIVSLSGAGTAYSMKFFDYREEAVRDAVAKPLDGCEYAWQSVRLEVPDGCALYASGGALVHIKHEAFAGDGVRLLYTLDKAGSAAPQTHPQLPVVLPWDEASELPEIPLDEMAQCVHGAAHLPDARRLQGR